MALENLKFENTLNKSLQVNDSVYYAEVMLDANGNEVAGVTTTPLFLGTVWQIYNNINNTSIDVEVASTGLIPVNANGVPSGNTFILFSKSIKVNESGIKGYYADVTLENRSKESVELFAISSEIALSSK